MTLAVHLKSTTLAHPAATISFSPVCIGVAFARRPPDVGSLRDCLYSLICIIQLEGSVEDCRSRQAEQSRRTQPRDGTCRLTVSVEVQASFWAEPQSPHFRRKNVGKMVCVAKWATLPHSIELGDVPVSQFMRGVNCMSPFSLSFALQPPLVQSCMPLQHPPAA